VTAREAAALFHGTYGRHPVVVASAPGRVNLIGEHTDYNGGEVLPIAIAQRTYVAMGPSGDGESHAVSRGEAVAGRFSVREAQPAGHWWDYVHGTLRELANAGADAGEVDVAVVSEVPARAGLSSSAALEVATAIAGVVVAGAPMVDAWDRLAGVAHRAETGFVGVACGIMDQTVSAYAAEGHALRVWCDSGRTAQVPFSRAVLVVDTMTPRGLRTSAFNERQRSCQRALRALRGVAPGLQHLAHASEEQLDSVPMDATDRRRARHVIAETRRVGAFVAALEVGSSLGSLLHASHESLRTDYECSCDELDWVVGFAAAQEGVEGARMTGAGWGGCAIVVGTPDGLEALAGRIAPAFEARWSRPPRTWISHAEEGGDVDWVASLEAE
jgi:galactokinase